VKSLGFRFVPALALAALATTASAFDAPAASPAPASPRIGIEPAAFDFGNVLAGGTVDKEFVIRNFGAADLTLASVTTTCGCTVAEGYAKTIRPGASTPLRVSLSVGGRPGRLQKSVLVKSNDPAKPNLEIKVEANVQARPAQK
jgi:hypothetical protein